MSYTEFAPKPNPFSALAANNSDLRPALADLALAHTFAHDLGLRRSVSAAINWREQRNGHPPEVVNGITFRNAQIGEFARKIDTPRGIANLQQHLERTGALHIPFHTRNITIQGEAKTLTLVGASENGSGEMTSNYWIRDQVQIAQSLMERFFRENRTEDYDNARSLLLSLLTVMSTPGQIRRFEETIRHRNDAEYLAVPHHHPNIFFDAKSLNGEEDKPWAQRQDAWQMLVSAVVDAIETKVLSPEDIEPNHQEFLALAALYLHTVDRAEMPSSGSWEEIESSKRTSVLAWNSEALRQLLVLSEQDQWQSIAEIFFQKATALGVECESFAQTCANELTHQLQEIENALPFEAAHHDEASPQHRKADASLIYLLNLGTCRLMAHYLHPSMSFEEREQEARRLETEIVEQVMSLMDPATNGILRYQGDSYQDREFWTPSTQALLGVLYNGGGATSDYSRVDHFTGREEIITEANKGTERSAAAWTMFQFQLTSWAARKASELRLMGTTEGEDVSYQKFARECLLRGLATITGEHEFTIRRNDNGTCQLIELPSYRIPECIITAVGEHGENHHLPSPHTQLNWAVAEAIRALGLYEGMIAICDNTQAE